ncbi:MAG TPA: deoxyribodipyrimidine photo-lyase [Candidatus Limnocylindrales bacterium]
MRGDRPIVVWFRRDLRLHDHPALTEATSSGSPVAPLVVIDPALLHGRFASPNRTFFYLWSVAALRASLEGLGSRLFVRVGDPVAVVPAFARDVGASEVLVSRDYTPYGRRRDAAVADALRTDGGELRAKRGLLIHEPEDLTASGGGAYTVFGPYQRRWWARPMRDVLPAPTEVAAVDAPDGAIPDIASLGIGGPTADPSALPEPGETAGRARLDAWLAAGPDHGPGNYHRTRDGLADMRATSRLSTDLRFGTLSPIDIATRAMAADAGGEGSRRFVTELAWRDFYAHALWHAPRIAREPLDERYRDMAYERDDVGLAAWRDGRTGYPIVDAGMRQLRQTGWLPNRARMIVSSFLTKDLLIDWREGERIFMERLVDGDPASNLGNWQWVASIGTDSRSFVRIFNPSTQAKRFDPDGAYVRRWVPELAGIAGARVHEPWTMTYDEQERAGCRIGIDYPAPIVDHDAARRRALARYAAAASSQAAAST